MAFEHLGDYSSLSEAWADNPYGGQEGDTVNISGVLYTWDKYDRNWVSSSTSPSSSTSQGNRYLNFLGHFNSISEFVSDHSPGSFGDYAVIAGITYLWDASLSSWVPEVDSGRISPARAVTEHLPTSEGNKDLEFLGEYPSLGAVWDAYPHGGKDGDYVSIAGIHHRWNKFRLNWISQEESTPAKIHTEYDGDVSISGDLYVGGTLRPHAIVLPDRTKFEINNAVEKARLEAEKAAKLYADAVAEANRVQQNALTDGKITAAEQRVIDIANENARLARLYADAKDQEMLATVQAYADGRLTEIESSHIELLKAQAELYLIELKAKMDGVITRAEQAAIDAAKKRVEDLSKKLSEDIENLKKKNKQIVEDIDALRKISEDLLNQKDGEVSQYTGAYKPTLSNYPASEWTSVEDKENHAGDVFIDNRPFDEAKEEGFIWKWKKLEDGQYGWERVVNIQELDLYRRIAQMEALLDGKSTIYLRKPTRYNTGDMWILEEEMTLNNVLYRKGTILIAKQSSDTFDETHWYSPIDYISEEVIDEKIEEGIGKAKSYTDTKWSDVVATMDALEKSLEKKLGKSVSAVSVKTMQLIAGHESLQFVFVDGFNSNRVVSHTVSYDNDTRNLIVPSGYLQHRTIGITTTKPNRSASEYKTWQMSEFRHTLSDDVGAVNLFAKVSRGGSSGEFVLSPSFIDIEEVPGYYHFMLGLITAPPDRVYSQMYGFSEITPARAVLNKIVSASGKSFWDLLTGSFHIGEADGAYMDYNSLGDNKFRIKGAIVSVGGKDTSIEEALGKAKPGRGISLRVVEHYLSLSNTHIVGGRWIRGMPESTPKGRHLWLRDLVFYTDDTHEIGSPYCIPSGQDGKDGAGISRVDVEYAINTDKSVPPVSGWNTSPMNPSEGQYLWSRTAVYYEGNGEPARTTPICLTANISVAAGVGVESIIEQYYLSDSDTERVGGEETDVPPAPQAGKYIWTRTVFVLTDGNRKETAWLCVQGRDGQNGKDGERGQDGKGIMSIEEWFYISTSRDAQSGGSWSMTKPSADQIRDRYLWTKTKITYSNGEYLWTTPTCVTGADGKPGEGITEYRAQFIAHTSGKDAPTKFDPLWSDDMPEMTKERRFLWSRWVYRIGGGVVEYSNPVFVSEDLEEIRSAAKFLATIIKDPSHYGTSASLSGGAVLATALFLGSDPTNPDVEGSVRTMISGAVPYDRQIVENGLLKKIPGVPQAIMAGIKDFGRTTQSEAFRLDHNGSGHWGALHFNKDLGGGSITTYDDREEHKDKKRLQITGRPQIPLADMLKNASEIKEGIVSEVRLSKIRNEQSGERSGTLGPSLTVKHKGTEIYFDLRLVLKSELASNGVFGKLKHFVRIWVFNETAEFSVGDSMQTYDMIYEGEHHFRVRWRGVVDTPGVYKLGYNWEFSESYNQRDSMVCLIGGELSNNPTTNSIFGMYYNTFSECVEITSTGISVMMNNKKFFYLDMEAKEEEPFLSVKGKVDMPGFLAGGVIDKRGYPTKKLGKFIESRKISQGRYRINHNVGHTNYVVSATHSCTDSDKDKLIARIIENEIQPTSCVIEMQWDGTAYDGGFMFEIKGEN